MKKFGAITVFSPYRYAAIAATQLYPKKYKYIMGSLKFHGLNFKKFFYEWNCIKSILIQFHTKLSSTIHTVLVLKVFFPFTELNYLARLTQMISIINWFTQENTIKLIFIEHLIIKNI